eukprot:scaffold3064_cov231-Pinguiococcus_pyrenoidosus.AAC.3
MFIREFIDGWSMGEPVLGKLAPDRRSGETQLILGRICRRPSPLPVLSWRDRYIIRSSCVDGVEDDENGAMPGCALWTAALTDACAGTWRGKAAGALSCIGCFD